MYEITTRINQLLGRGMLAAREIEVGIAREEIDKGTSFCLRFKTWFVVIISQYYLD